VVRKAGVDRLDPTGAILGLSRQNRFRELTIPFEPGDILAAFSDGVAETVGPREVVRILREEPDTPVAELTSNLLDAAPSTTDRTLILVRSSISEAAIPLAAYALAVA
jgi:serine/threonine protein phosphatase PrpC